MASGFKKKMLRSYSFDSKIYFFIFVINNGPFYCFKFCVVSPSARPQKKAHRKIAIFVVEDDKRYFFRREKVACCMRYEQGFSSPARKVSTFELFDQTNSKIEETEKN
jgi:hypothetical protein